MSYSSVQKEVKRQRAALLCRGSVQLQYDPGDKLQIDFGQSRVYISGQLTTVHYLVGVLCHSQYTMARVYASQSQECLLDGLIAMFRHRSECRTTSSSTTPALQWPAAAVASHNSSDLKNCYINDMTNTTGSLTCPPTALNSRKPSSHGCCRVGSESMKASPGKPQ